MCKWRRQTQKKAKANKKIKLTKKAMGNGRLLPNGNGAHAKMNISPQKRPWSAGS
jgi:hypothetical protein